MDIAITWPKSRTLESYLSELEKAADAGLVINYRVPSYPKKLNAGDRCYMVHDGVVRGWNEVLGVEERDDVTDPVSGALMRPGVYVVRNPYWMAEWGVERPMKGFRGFRYVNFSDPFKPQYVPPQIYLQDDVQGEPVGF